MKVLTFPKSGRKVVIADLKADPYKYCKGLPIGVLVTLLKFFDKKYHEDGTSPISDAVYDKMQDTLLERSPEHPYLKATGYTPSPKQREKVQLPYYMPSLDKCKAGAKLKQQQIGAWRAKRKGPYVISDKLDGISLAIVYSAGGQMSAFTRGDGVEGQDVSQLLPVLKVPKRLKRKLAVRAEVIMPPAVFEELKKSVRKKDGTEYENPRNMGAGLLNSNEFSKALARFDVVAHQVISPRLPQEEQFQLLKSLKYKIPVYKVVDDITEGELVEYLMARRKASPYEIDGIVVAENRKTPLPQMGSGYPEHMRAFKIEDLSGSMEVKVTDIVWQQSRHNYLIPVVHVEPVRLSGVTVTKATAHNAKFIEDKKIGPGAIIRIIRSGDVIPKIIEVIKPARKAKMPTIDYNWTTNDKGENVNIVAVVEIDETIAKRIAYFFSTIGVDGIKLGTARLLVEAGYSTVEEIVKLEAMDLVTIEGFQQTKARKLVTSIQKALRTATFPQLAAASGLLGYGVGIDRMKMVLDQHPNLVKDVQTITPQALATLLRTTPGIDKYASQIAGNFPRLLTFLRGVGVDLERFRTAPVKQPSGSAGHKLSGIFVVMTGFRDSALQAFIEQNGGIVQNSVTKKTTLVIAKDLSKGSTKIDKAQAMGIQVMSLADFQSKYQGR